MTDITFQDAYDQLRAQKQVLDEHLAQCIESVTRSEASTFGVLHDWVRRRNAYIDCLEKNAYGRRWYKELCALNVMVGLLGQETHQLGYEAKTKQVPSGFGKDSRAGKDTLSMLQGLQDGTYARKEDFQAAAEHVRKRAKTTASLREQLEYLSLWYSTQWRKMLDHASSGMLGTVHTAIEDKTQQLQNVTGAECAVLEEQIERLENAHAELFAHCEGVLKARGGVFTSQRSHRLHRSKQAVEKVYETLWGGANGKIVLSARAAWQANHAFLVGLRRYGRMNSNMLKVEAQAKAHGEQLVQALEQGQVGNLSEGAMKTLKEVFAVGKDVAQESKKFRTKGKGLAFAGVAAVGVLGVMALRALGPTSKHKQRDAHAAVPPQGAMAAPGSWAAQVASSQRAQGMGPNPAL